MARENAARAIALVGTRFAPQGRDPASGLDCVGLVVAAFGLPSGEVRCDYRLRGKHEAEMLATVGKWFGKVRRGRENVGDLLVMRVSTDQLHLGITTDIGFVHAHAGLRRVVETPGDPPWPVIGRYRRRKDR